MHCGNFGNEIDDDMTEVPAAWVEEYHWVLDGAPKLKHRFGMRIGQSELYASSERFDELSRPIAAGRLVCAKEHALTRIERAISFYD